MKLFFSILMIQSFSLFATESEAQKLYDEAFALYQTRTNEDLSIIEKVKDLTLQAKNYVESAELKYDILLLSSKAYYFLGTRTEDSDKKLELLQVSMNESKSATEVLNLAESTYMFGVALGRYCETYGILKCIVQGKRKEMVKAMQDTQQLQTRLNESGKSYDGFGADRVLGRMEYKLSKFGQGDRALALSFLKTSYDNAPTFANAVHFYAEALEYKGSTEERQLGCSFVSTMLQTPVEKLNPDRVVDAVLEYKEAQDFYNSKCK